MVMMQKILRSIIRPAPVTSTLCLVIIAVYILTVFQSHSIENNLSGSAIAQSLTLYLPAMDESVTGPLRAIGTLFVHQGPTHLVSNVFLLYLFGREVERYLGKTLMAGTFFSGGIGSSAAVSYFNPLNPTVGASGALYTLMAIVVGITALKKRNITAPVVLVLANIVSSFLEPNISIAGHAGGLVVGIILCLALRKGRRIYKRIMNSMLIIVIILVVAAVYFGPQIIQSYIEFRTSQ